jgi:hypothetical protein
MRTMKKLLTILLLQISFAVSAFSISPASYPSGDNIESVAQFQEPTTKNSPRKKPTTDKSKIITNLSTTNAIKTAFPFTPKEIKMIKRIMDKNQAAMSSPKIPNTFRNRSISISTAPGSVSPEIIISPGYITSLILLDKNGTPWPIDKIALGSANNFQFSKASENVVTISPTNSFSTSNAIVFLKNLTTPLVITIKTSSDIVDFKVEARVNRTNISKAQSQNISKFSGTTSIAKLLSSLSLSSDELSSLALDGIPPSSFTKLKNNAPFVLETWLNEELIYVRTEKELLSPAFLSKLTSSNGTYLYKIPYMANLLFIESGRVMPVKLVRSN